MWLAGQLLRWQLLCSSLSLPSEHPAAHSALSKLTVILRLFQKCTYFVLNRSRPAPARNDSGTKTEVDRSSPGSSVDIGGARTKKKQEQPTLPSLVA